MGGKLLLRANEHSCRETGAYAGPDFFRIFSFPLLQGNSESVLSAPYTVVISRQLADKYRTLVVQAPVIRTDSTFQSKVNAFKEEITRFPGIRRMAVSTAIPGEPSGWMQVQTPKTALSNPVKALRTK